MKFYIKSINLWFKNGSEPRIIIFQNNKVNIITGEKSKGKSSIISIVDYCLLSTLSRIVEDVINENISWYGLSFSINDKDYIIIRKHPENHVGSKEVYFSGTGEIPKIIKGNIDIKKLKTIIENEFGIDEKFVVPYGGKKLKLGSKISFRYFLLFNTISEDTIANTTTFFDFDLYDRQKYVEALDRIFFLAIGVDDISNVLIKEQLAILENDLDKIQKKKKSINNQERLFNENIIHLLSRAQEYDLIERRVFTFDEAYEALNSLVTHYTGSAYSNNLKLIDDLNKEKRTLWRRIRSLERFNDEYEDYRKTLLADEDSLLPIEYLNSNYSELIPTIEVKLFLNTLANSLQIVKNEIAGKRSITINVNAELNQLKGELVNLERKLSNLPTNTKEFKDEVQKFIFIGELKSQLSFYKDKWNLIEELPNEDEIVSSIYELNQTLKDTAEKKKVILEFLESCIQKYYDLTNSMGVYKDYKVSFDVNKKVLKLRKPEEIISRVIGSKSNYMFLHLCLFLGIHEHLIKQKQKYVPQFLILDQPSQPYLEKKSMDPKTGIITSDDDRNTIKDAFALLDKFITIIKKEYDNEFQVILLEHASKDYWEEPFLENFYLVEEFRNGNALIPESAIKTEKTDE